MNTTARKRKRSSFSLGGPPLLSAPSASSSRSATAAAAHASGSKVLNPLSHTPNTVKQFVVAGLSVDAPVPSKVYAGFPHLAIPPRHRLQKQEQRQRKYAHFYSSDLTGDASGYESGADPCQFEDEDEEDEIEARVIDPTTDDEHDENELSRTRFRSMAPAAGGHQNQQQQKKKKSKKRKPAELAAERAAAHKKHVGGLLQVIEKSLMEGKIATAKRAFALLVRSRIYGDKVDLRYGDYWKLGLDVLLREGEEEERRRERRRKKRKEQKDKGGDGGLHGALEGSGEDDLVLEGQQHDENDDDDDDDDEDEEEAEYKFARRRAANVLAKVKAYYETLIKLHPYNRTRPNSVSALNFYPAMFQFELDDVRTEHGQGLERLERLRRLGGSDGLDEEDDAEEHRDEEGHGHGHENGDSMDVDNNYDGDRHHHSTKRPSTRGVIDHPKDRLRQHALSRLTEIALRMDKDVLLNLPFSKDYSLLSLRAEISLLMSDLLIPCLLPTAPSSPSEEEDRAGEVRIRYEFEADGRKAVDDGRQARVKERLKAKKILKRMKKLVVGNGGQLDKADEEALRVLRREFRSLRSRSSGSRAGYDGAADDGEDNDDEDDGEDDDEDDDDGGEESSEDGDELDLDDEGGGRETETGRQRRSREKTGDMFSTNMPRYSSLPIRQ